jgi:ABC-2 type transport system ATP-binding protein
MIQASGLTKRYGHNLAVDGLSFQVRPGRVTGFLGPNGAGKSTTMRLILGLDAPTGGRVTVNGRSYRELPAPLWEVGALLDARAVHGGRTAHDHLLWLARSNRIPRRRVGEALELVGLAPVASRRIRGFSLGMAQRLGIAAALLGDPGVLVFDEPVNGLDTEGIRWIRDLMKGLAAEGRTVLVSSHLMSEMELTADHLIVIGQGRLLADTSVQELIERSPEAVTLVRSPHWERLRELLEGHGARVRPDRQERWRVLGPDAAAIGRLAADYGIALHELTPRRSSLEEVYVRMTDTTVEYRAGVRRPTSQRPRPAASEVDHARQG